jgi:hypothetical protein
LSIHFAYDLINRFWAGKLPDMLKMFGVEKKAGIETYRRIIFSQAKVMRFHYFAGITFA